MLSMHFGMKITVVVYCLSRKKLLVYVGVVMLHASFTLLVSDKVGFCSVLMQSEYIYIYVCISGILLSDLTSFLLSACVWVEYGVRISGASFLVYWEKDIILNFVFFIFSIVCVCAYICVCGCVCVCVYVLRHFLLVRLSFGGSCGHVIFIMSSVQPNI